MITDQKRVFHRPRRNHKRLHQRGGSEEQQQNGHGPLCYAIAGGRTFYIMLRIRGDARDGRGLFSHSVIDISAKTGAIFIVTSERLPEAVRELSCALWVGLAKKFASSAEIYGSIVCGGKDA